MRVPFPSIIGSSIRSSLPIVAALVAAAASSSCNSDGSNALCAGTVYDPNTMRTMDFGATAVGHKINALLDTSSALVRAATNINTELLTTCNAMATALGIPATETAAPADMSKTPTEASCNRVLVEIDKIIKENLPTSATLTIVATPAVCTIDAMVTRTCIETCQMKQVTDTYVQCKPGKLYGMCSGGCSGTCEGSCGAQCNGSCTASCTGTCSGTCNGDCAGTCAVKNAAGKCAGACMGTCTGTCGGTCTGSCTGSCSGSCMGSCSGECHGGCDVMFVAPKCEEIEVMRTVTECDTSCETKSHAEATCTPGMVTVDFNVDVTMAQKAKLDLLVTTLKTNLPTILKLAKRSADMVAAAANGYVTALTGFSTAVGEVGVQAAACMASAANAVGKALGQISFAATFTVSVSVSASAKGGVSS